MQFFTAGFVYWALSTIFPNADTKLDKGVYPDDFETTESSLDGERASNKDLDEKSNEKTFVTEV